MMKQIAIDQSSFKILYLRYKHYFIPTIVIITSIILFLQLIIPQYNDFVLMKQEEDDYRQKIDILTANINYLSNLNNQDLDSQVDLLTTALPLEKDYVGILTSISSAARTSGIELDDFTFLVGKLATQEANLAQSQPSILVTLNVQGPVNSIRVFLKSLSSSFPLSEVLSLKSSAGRSEASTSFFYRPVKEFSREGDEPIVGLSPESNKLIDLLTGWKNNSPVFDGILPPPPSDFVSPVPFATESAPLVIPTAIPEASPSGTIIF